MKISKKLFYILAFLLPVNLGNHFIYSFSYVNGILVDYLIYTIYIQDILISLILFFWLIERYFFIKNSLVSCFRLNTLFKIKIYFKNNLFNDFIFLLKYKPLYLWYFFIFSIFLSSLASNDYLISLMFFSKNLLYFGLFLYLVFNFNVQKDLSKFIKILIISISLVGILGIIQYVKQGSVFNNYLIFGEQPYSISTPNIRVENIFGFSKVASYGLFRHSNIFAGFLSIVGVWSVIMAKRKKYYLYFSTLIFVSLIFTFSLTGYLSFILGLLLVGKYEYFKYKRRLLMTLYFIILVFSILIFSFDTASLGFNFSSVGKIQEKYNVNTFDNIFRYFEDIDYGKIGENNNVVISSENNNTGNNSNVGKSAKNNLGDYFGTNENFGTVNYYKINTDFNIVNYDSFNKRSVLTKSTFLMIQNNFSYGVGEGMFTKYLSDYLVDKSIMYSKFIQPVHNLFLLVLSQSGIISFVFFIMILFYTFLSTKNIFLFVSFVQMGFLSMFDHYFWTIHQTNILLWILFGLCWTSYNKYFYNVINE